MKSIILLAIALILIVTGIFLGVGMRTKASVTEKSHQLELTEKRS
jgi:hypothetical protein